MAPPSAGETQYVYREITAEQPVTVEIDCIVRSPESDRGMDEYGMEYWRRTGRYTWWVNGVEIVKWGGRGSRDMPFKAKVQLSKGKNHFLAKFTNNRHAYGFAFSLYGMHPNLRHERGFETLWEPLEVNKITDLPFYREAPELPDWFVKKDDWLASLVASRDRHAGPAGQFAAIWPALYAAFDSPQARRQISLAQLLCGRGKSADELLEKQGPALEACLASRFADHARKVLFLGGPLAAESKSARQVIADVTHLARS